MNFTSESSLNLKISYLFFKLNSQNTVFTSMIAIFSNLSIIVRAKDDKRSVVMSLMLLLTLPFKVVEAYGADHVALPTNSIRCYQIE